MRQLPTGTITLLFTDIEGSTRLLQRLGNAYASVLKECRRLLREAFQQENGFEVDTQGDAFFVVFERAIDAISAAAHAQRALFATRWPDETVVRVRMGIHTGEPQPTEEGYIGLDVHFAARIMSAAYGGQVLLSQTTHELVASDLPEEITLLDLGAYQLKDIIGLNELFQLVMAGIPADFPPLTNLSTRRTFQNIPSPSTSFVGREREATTLRELLRRTDVRLLTLLGTAGVGKTRLALHVATQLNSLFPDGVCFVALDQVNDADAVLPGLAQVLNIQEEKGRTLFDQVKDVLCELSLLLVLDNFEQVMSARQVVADLLVTCPHMKVLVTSRVLLHMQAEHVFDVYPLPLPDLAHLPDLATLSSCASIALYVQRAQAVQPGFQLTAANITAVAGICVRLDGIPLAIELAAARTRHFQPSALLKHLQHGLTMLQSSAQDVPTRQQTLRSAITWSYDLLSAAEQRVFRCFAVCVSGATQEAAEQICAAASAESVAEVLAALVDKSMLQRQVREEGDLRFWQLQTLREYAIERLAEAGELEATRAAHATYYLSWVEQVAPLLSGLAFTERALSETASTLPGEEGIAPTINHNPLQSERAQALQGAAFLALVQDEYVHTEVFLRESQLLFRESGDRAGMANILRLQGSLALARNSYKLARRLLEEARAIYRERGDIKWATSTQAALAQVAIAQCDYARARSLLRELIEDHRMRNEPYRTAFPLYLLARTHFLSRGDLAESHTLAEESLALFKAVGNRRLVAYVRILLGQLLFLKEQQVDRARSLLEESIAIMKAVKDRAGTAEAFIALARLATFQDENELARNCCEESWTLLRSSTEKGLSAACLEGHGEVLVALNAPRQAVQLWATAATVRAAILAPMPPIYRASYVRAVAHAREQLGEEAFQTAWSEGHKTPLEQISLSRVP